MHKISSASNTSFQKFAKAYSEVFRMRILAEYSRLQDEFLIDVCVHASVSLDIQLMLMQPATFLLALCFIFSVRSTIEHVSTLFACKLIQQERSHVSHSYFFPIDVYWGDRKSVV